jgi:hypothetical protein
MTASYVSARFENAEIPALSRVRCIIRNLDDGPVPPVPGPTYFPTSPDQLRPFCLLEYVNDTLGERFVNVATLSDLGLYSYQASPLTRFVDPTADFVTAGVSSGDTLIVTIPEPTEWQSEEYPAMPFQFGVLGVTSPTEIELVRAFPSFKTNLTWSIPGRTNGTLTGKTQRFGVSPGNMFLDTRFNLLFNDVASLDAFVAAAKASLDALGQSSTASTLTSFNYSSQV